MTEVLLLDYVWVSYSGYDQSNFVINYKIVVFIQCLLQKLDQSKVFFFFPK